jgi:hypothetical protein
MCTHVGGSNIRTFHGTRVRPLLRKYKTEPDSRILESARSYLIHAHGVFLLWS